MIGISFALSVIIILFSTTTAQFRSSENEVSVTKKYHVGDVISLQEPLCPLFVTLNGQSFTELKKHKLLIAAIPLQEQKYISLAYTRLSEKSNEVIWSWAPVEIQSTPTPKEKVHLSHEVQRKIADSEVSAEEQKLLRLAKAYALDDGDLSPCWQKPLNSRVMSKFASHRVLPNQENYYHTGIDLRAAIGTPVRSPQGGKVVYVDELAITGKTVAVYHGSGIVSKMAHLDKIWVSENELVQKDQVLGLSGNTGRSTGPHLHWEVVWRGIPLNPLEFLQFLEPICDPT